MMYTRERLMKAVRDAGRDGQPFTLGEVRATLGFKSQDKRELKRFRSRFRECCQILGDNLEKLGPNTFRLKGIQPEAKPAAALKTLAAIKPAGRATTKSPQAQPEAARAAQVARLMDRVGVRREGLQDASNVTPADPPETDTLKRRPREAVSFEQAGHAVQTAQAARGPSFGERVSSWFGRTRTPNANAAATALSRLAVDLQPKASNFEYRWIDGKLQVQRAGEK
jgi:hypothetical protein